MPGAGERPVLKQTLPAPRTRRRNIMRLGQLANGQGPWGSAVFGHRDALGHLPARAIGVKRGRLAHKDADVDGTPQAVLRRTERHPQLWRQGGAVAGLLRQVIQVAHGAGVGVASFLEEPTIQKLCAHVDLDLREVLLCPASILDDVETIYLAYAEPVVEAAQLAQRLAAHRPAAGARHLGREPGTVILGDDNAVGGQHLALETFPPVTVGQHQRAGQRQRRGAAQGVEQGLVARAHAGGGHALGQVPQLQQVGGRWQGRVLGSGHQQAPLKSKRTRRSGPAARMGLVSGGRRETLTPLSLLERGQRRASSGRGVGRVAGVEPAGQPRVAVFGE